MIRWLILLLLACPAWAQDQDELLRTFRNSWQGAPLTAAVFQRYVTVEAEPGWWSFWAANAGHKGYQFVLLGEALVGVAKNLGLGDAAAASSLGTPEDYPPLRDMIDSWKGRLGVHLALPPGLKPEQKNVVMDNLALLSSPVLNSSVCLPRGGRFFLKVSFDAKLTALRGQVSKDGNSYELTFPTYADISTSQLEDVFKKGLK